MKCKNCENDFVGNYCNVCGQKVMNRLTIKSILTLIVDDVFEVNKGLLHTVRQLWINPGKTSFDFINGRTKNYYSPLKYLIFWTAVYFILSPVLENRQELSIKELLFNTTKPFSADSFQEYMTIYTEMIFRHTDLFYLGLTPFLAIVSYVTYRKRKFYFMELSVLYLYILGQIIFVFAIAIPFMGLFGDNNLLLIFILPLTAIILYLVIKSHKQFFGETWTKSSIKGLVILYVGQLIYMLTTLIIFNGIKTFNMK
jgi:hypothetical protein